MMSLLTLRKRLSWVVCPRFRGLLGCRSVVGMQSEEELLSPLKSSRSRGLS